MTNRVTLDHLIPDATDHGETPDFFAAVFECSSVLQELVSLKRDVTTYEAAKIINKSKATPKKTKIKKQTMVAKEAMDYVGNDNTLSIAVAISPYPNGISVAGYESVSEQFLIDNPSANVTVTTACDGDTSVGFEGVDWEYRYEGVDLISLEGGIYDITVKIWRKIVELVRKIIQWVKSVELAIQKKLINPTRFLKTNEDLIKRGLASDAIITVHRVSGISARNSMEGLFNDAERVIDAISDIKPGRDIDDSLLDIFEFDNPDRQMNETRPEYRSVYGRIFEVDKTSAANDIPLRYLDHPMIMRACGWTFDDLQWFFNTAPDKLRDIRKRWGVVERIMGVKPLGININSFTRSVQLMYKAMIAIVRVFVEAESQALYIMQKAAEAGHPTSQDQR